MAVTRHLLIILTFIVISSCSDEESLVIGEKQLIDYESDSTFVNSLIPEKQNKKVLLQEFTGVYCYTCPLAHEITKSLISQFSNRVIPINVHSHLFGLYDDPDVMGNLYDFRTQAGDSIVSMLGGINSIPSAAFNMTLQSGEVQILSSNRDNWSEYFNEELAEPSKVNIEIASKIESANNRIKIVVKYELTEDIQDEFYYSIALTESNIIDKQFVDTAVVDDYNHHYILRDVINDPKGNFLSKKSEKGKTFIKVHYIDVQPEWDLHNINVVSYLHKSGESFSVYQAEEHKL